MYENDEDQDESDEMEISFSFKKDVKPDMSTYKKRFQYYLSLTNPLYFFKTNDQVELAGDVVERVKNLEQQYKDKGKGKL